MELKVEHVRNFWCKVDKGEKDDCWCWTATVNSKGYGSMSINGKSYSAHRVSFYIHNGYLPRLNVLHSCDTPRCVNPKHLFLGTQLDNVRDMIEKGRANMKGLKYSGRYL